MGTMSVEVPEIDQLLAMTSPARYGDELPDEGSRGGVSTYPRYFPPFPAPSGIRFQRPSMPIRNDSKRHLACRTRVRQSWSGGRSRILEHQYEMGHSPYLRSLMADGVNQRPIATCMPSTTVAAMSTFGTGTCPGLTGMTGYTQLNPDNGEICQLISFKNAPAPLKLQQQPTIFERLAEQDVRVTSSGLPKFAFSALTQAALRGSDYISNDDPRRRIMTAAKAANTPGLTYGTSRRGQDRTQLRLGLRQVDRQYERVDAQLSLLRRSVPKNTLIVIVADHGMITADPEACIDIASEPQLMRGVANVGGEPRCVMLYGEGWRESGGHRRSLA